MDYNFCLFFNFFVPKKYFLKVLDGALFLWTLWVFLLGLPNLKNDINYIKYKFSHRFGKVCRWLNMYYSNIIIILFFKVTTMSICIILNNLVWTYRECNFCHYLVIVPCIHLMLYNLQMSGERLDNLCSYPILKVNDVNNIHELLNSKYFINHLQ
jgi:hypothetical protein